MTVLELVRQLRRRLDDLLDSDSDRWVEDDHDCLWSNQELVSYLNEAQNEHTRRVPLRDSRTASVCILSLQPGISEYALDPRVLSVERVTLDEVPLRKIFDDDRDVYHWEPTCPVEAYEEDLDEHRIRIFDTPVEAALLRLSVERMPLCELSWDDPEARPEINSRYHSDLLDWAAHLAYQKDSADTLKIDASARYRETFTSAVGPRSSRRRDQFMQHKANARKHVRCYF